MLNLFRRSEATKKTTSDEGISSPEKELVNEVNHENDAPGLENVPAKKETVGDVFNELRRVMIIKQELGNDISPEEVEQVTGMSLEDFGEFLNGEEIDIKANGGQLMETLQSAMEATDGEIKEGTLKKFIKNKTVRVAFVTLMLLLKFAPQSQGAELPVKDKTHNNTEESFDHQNNIEPDNTYHPSLDDLDNGNKNNLDIESDAKPLESSIIESGRNVQFDLTNYFDTDSDNIAETSKAQIGADFEKFLGQITADNIDDILNSQLVIYGSSDERETMNEKWQGQNFNLTKARLTSAENILHEALQSFSFNGIPEDKVDDLKAMDFKYDMPRSQTGAEAGVDYITDRVNPDSSDGHNFTAEEVKDMKINNPDKYKQLLDDGRKVIFKVVVDNSEDVKKIEPKKMELEHPEESIELMLTPSAIENLSDYQNVTLIFDNSPSVANSYNYMADVIDNQDFNGVKVDFAVFSDKMGHTETYKNSQEVVDAIKDIKYNGNNEEKSISSAISAIKQLSDNQKNAVFVMTDENFQDVSQDKLNELRSQAREKNADVFFYYADDDKKVVNQVSLDDIEASYQDAVYKLLAPKIASEISLQENKVAALEKILDNHQAKLTDLEKLAQKGSSKVYQRGYQAAQDREVELLANIEQNREALETLHSKWENKSFDDLFASDVLKDIFDGKGGRVKLDSKLVCTVSGEELGSPAMQLMADSQIAN